MFLFEEGDKWQTMTRQTLCCGHFSIRSLSPCTHPQHPCPRSNCLTENTVSLYCYITLLHIAYLKELVPFTQLVKVRRGKLVLALPSIRFSCKFYQIISGTKYEKKTYFRAITCHSWQDNGKKQPFFHGILTYFWHFSLIATIFMFQKGWSGVPQAGHT